MRSFTESCHRFCFLLLVLCLAQPLAAQVEEEEPQPRKVFQERIGIEVVNIDVVVTDKKGRPVEGLARDDFELRVDGRDVGLANFYAVTAAAELPEEGEEEPWQAVEPAAVEPRDPLHLVVYLDSYYLTPISRQRVLRDLPGFFAEQVAGGARVMLMTHDQETRVLAPFTSDLAELEAALARAEEAPAVGIQQTTGRRSALDNIRSIYQVCEDSPVLAPCIDCLSQMIEMAEIYSLAVISERRAASRALGRVVNALSVLEGRKAVVHVSDGIQQQGGVDMFFYIGEQLCPEQQTGFQEYYMRQDVYDLADLVAQANASRVTFYALEAAGLRNFSSASAEYADHFFKPSVNNDQLRIANLRSTLHYISAETGGKAILNAKELAPDLGKITSELRSYYSLGYQPRHAGRGRTHRVSVKVPKRGYEVRFRRTFLHKTPEQQLADRALGVVLFGVTENPLAAEVRAGAQSPAGRTPSSEDRVVVPLEVSVPLAKLTLIPEDGARHGRLTVVVAAPGKKGKSTVIRKKEIPVTVPLAGEGAPQGDYRFGVNVELAPGEYQLGVGVWDDVAATGSFLGLKVRAAAEDAGGGT